jgi:hypothetical protein
MINCPNAKRYTHINEFHPCDYGTIDYVVAYPIGKTICVMKDGSEYNGDLWGYTLKYCEQCVELGAWRRV